MEWYGKTWVVTKSQFLYLGGVVCENLDFDLLISIFSKHNDLTFKMTYKEC